MKISQAQDEKLLEYIDGSLTGAEKESIEQVLQNSSELKTRLEELRSLHKDLHTIKIEHPTKNFTQRVMAKIEQYPMKSSKFTFKNGILLLAGVLVAVGIISFLMPNGFFDGTGSIDLNQTVIPTKYIEKPLPTFNFNMKIIVNVIILLNLALAFIVLDRTILKPWFERRRLSL